MAYKCIKSLTTTGNLMYYYGSQINEQLYKSLTPHEKKHFVKEILDFVPQKKKLDDSIYPDGRDFEKQIEDASFTLWQSSPNDDSYSSQSNSDSSSNVDYGGGDSGGGGDDGNY